MSGSMTRARQARDAAAAGAVAGAGVGVVAAMQGVRAVGAGCARAVRVGELGASVRGAIVGIAIVALGAFVFAVAVRVHERYRFNDAGPVALVMAGACVGAALVIGVAAIVIDRWVRRRVGERVLGRRGRAIAGASALAAVVATPALVTHW